MKVKQNDMAVFNIAGEGTYTLLNPFTKKLHTINQTGRVIWEACEEARDIDELASVVAEQFHIPVETAHKDVERFVNHMLTYDLMEKV